MYKAKNISHQEEGIAGISSFFPGEEREVSYNVYERLRRNPNFSCHTRDIGKPNENNTFVEEENDPIQKKKKK